MEIKTLAINATAKLIENILSKKFLVFITSTILVERGILPTTEWMTIALGVLGVEGALAFRKQMNKKTDSPALITPLPEKIQVQNQTPIAVSATALAIP